MKEFYPFLYFSSYFKTLYSVNLHRGEPFVFFWNATNKKWAPFHRLDKAMLEERRKAALTQEMASLACLFEGLEMPNLESVLCQESLPTTE